MKTMNDIITASTNPANGTIMTAVLWENIEKVANDDLLSMAKEARLNMKDLRMHFDVVDPDNLDDMENLDNVDMEDPHAHDLIKLGIVSAVIDGNTPIRSAHKENLFVYDLVKASINSNGTINTAHIMEELHKVSFDDLCTICQADALNIAPAGFNYPEWPDHLVWVEHLEQDEMYGRPNASKSEWDRCRLLIEIQTLEKIVMLATFNIEMTDG